MSVENSARDIALRWIDLYNDGTPDSYGSERFLELYDEDLKWREMPTRAFPAGRTGSVGALREALAAGQAALRNRHVSLRELVAETDRFALTFSWQATVASDAFAFLGLSPGDTMKLEVAQISEILNGKIQRSTEYVVVVPKEGLA